jgi:hypothetical protein
MLAVEVRETELVRPMLESEANPHIQNYQGKVE